MDKKKSTLTVPPLKKKMEVDLDKFFFLIKLVVTLVVKNLNANAGDTARDTVLIPGSGRSPGVGNSNMLQYTCLENFMERGALWATVHGVSKSDTMSD